MLPFEEYLVKAHKLSGLLFGLSALCRVGKRRIKFLTFAYLANCFFFLSLLEPSIFLTKFLETNFEYEPHLENNEGRNHNSESMYNMELGDEIFCTFSPVIMVLNIFTLGLHIIVLAHLRKMQIQNTIQC